MEEIILKSMLFSLNITVYTVLSYNIYKKVFDFNQNLNARLEVLRETSIKVCMPSRCKSSYKEAVVAL